MNNDTNDEIPDFEDAASEREWLAQERAMRRERLHLDPAGDDARALRYRMLARTLRQPLHERLPADFAQRVAAQAALKPVRKPLPVFRFESVLMIALTLAFMVAAAAVTSLYGNAWLPSIVAALPAPDPSAMRWLLMFASCIGLSWLLGQWQQHARFRSPD